MKMKSGFLRPSSSQCFGLHTFLIARSLQEYISSESLKFKNDLPIILGSKPGRFENTEALRKVRYSYKKSLLITYAQLRGLEGCHKLGRVWHAGNRRSTKKSPCSV